MFQELVHDFETAYMPRLAFPTRLKYTSLLRCHVKPRFSLTPVEELSTRRIDEWLATGTVGGLSWATRSSLRNLVSAIFTRAEIWGVYAGKNPATRASAGRKGAKYEKRKLTVEQTVSLLKAVPKDVRIICMVALFCGLRISEVLGLCWRHIDFGRGMLLIRQRYYRGDLDRTKSDKSDRDIPFGHLSQLLRKLYPGPQASGRFCFEIKTARGGVTRDDRALRCNFLNPAAKKLGIYYRGFGFHAFRREAVTAISSKAGAIQACRVAGHTSMDVTLLYGLDDYIKQEQAIKSNQEPFLIVGLLGASNG